MRAPQIGLGILDPLDLLEHVRIVHGVLFQFIEFLDLAVVEESVEAGLFEFLGVLLGGQLVLVAEVEVEARSNDALGYRLGRHKILILRSSFDRIACGRSDFEIIIVDLRGFRFVFEAILLHGNHELIFSRQDLLARGFDVAVGFTGLLLFGGSSLLHLIGGSSLHHLTAAPTSAFAVGSQVLVLDRPLIVLGLLLEKLSSAPIGSLLEDLGPSGDVGARLLGLRGLACVLQVVDDLTVGALNESLP